MAKQIKAIKCPHCGSVDKTKLDKDLFHCENCNTDYFLDNDDININVTNTTRTDNKIADLFNNKIYLIVLISIIGLGFILFIINSFMSQPTPKYKTYSVSSSPTTIPTSSVGIPTKPKDELPLKYNRNIIFNFYFLSSDNKLKVFYLVSRKFDNKYDKLNGIYYEIREADTGKIIESQLINKNIADDKLWRYAQFANAVDYLTYNDSTLFRFDERNMSVTDVTHSLFDKNPEFVSGIATIKTSSDNQYYFYVLTNNGLQYFYYPLENKVFNYETQRNENQSFFDKLQQSNKTDESAIHAMYQFVELTGDSSKSPALIKVQFKTSEENLDDAFRIIKNTNDKTYKISANIQMTQIISDKILASGRLFFSPKIIYGTADQLIIKTRNNAASTAPYNLQSLDVNTGDVKWTIKGDNHDLSFYYLGSNQKLIVDGENYIVELDSERSLLISSTTGDYRIINYTPEVIFEKDIK